MLPKLKEYYAAHIEINPKFATVEAPRVTLLKFCQKYQSALSPIACTRLINNTHHGKALRSVWRLLLSGVERKEHLVWLYGFCKY